ncbi:glycerate kinase [Halobacteriales archaeon SW_6_65_46]|nr:MAG: glycerate kinase [Halobacteriales archaeon SW_6_65_46]
MTDPHALARRCLRAGIDAARPSTVIDETLALDGSRLTVGTDAHDLDSYDDLLVVGGGNAAGAVAAELETLLVERIDDGIVVTDQPTATERIEQVEGDHPRPSDAALAGTERLRELLSRADDRTLVLAVVTGGASALLPAPADGVSLAELRATTDELLASGASIDELNAVRKHLSAVKGGRLADVAAPATAVTLLFSDVVGDDSGIIGSGPFAPDETTYEDALAVVDRYDLALPTAVIDRLRAGHAGEAPETPDAGAPGFEHVTEQLLASNHTAARAALATAREVGYEPLLLSTRIRGEARETARSAVAVGEEIAATGSPVEPPAVVVSGGETTVTVRDETPGNGGPNAEYALSAAIELDAPGVVVAAIDTDGIDGDSAVAGASVDAETVPRSERAAARRALDSHDAATYLAERGATIETGATGTNVNDLRVIVVG